VGQKVHPNGLRIGIIRDWNARWFAKDKDFPNLLVEDIKLREYIKEKLYSAGISKIEIERFANKIRFNIFTAKPGIIIGKGGAGVEDLRKELEKMSGKNVLINIVEVKNPELDAQLVAENIAAQIEKRVSYRRAMKQAIARAMKAGAKGIKTECSGRLAGAEMARTERYHEGNVPLQTLRADIDYGFAEAMTTYGKIGVKVWIYKGDVLPDRKADEQPVEGGDTDANAEAR